MAKLFAQVVDFFKLRYNWHISLYLFQVYHIMIWYLYRLQNDHHSKSRYHPSPSKVTYFFLLMRTFKIYYLSNFQVCNTIILTIFKYMIHYISMTYLFYTWKFVPLTPFTHFAHLLTPIPSSTTNFVTVSVSLILFCFLFVRFFRVHI